MPILKDCVAVARGKPDSVERADAGSDDGPPERGLTVYRRARRARV